jgi:hypothetical protein
MLESQHFEPAELNLMQLVVDNLIVADLVKWNTMQDDYFHY